MKILMICDGYFLNFTYQENLLAKHYISNGHFVTILASTHYDINKYMAGINDKHSTESISYEYGAKIIKIKYSINFFNKFKKLRNISNYIFSEKPDLIYVHGILFNIHESIGYMKINPNCKLIVDFHGDYSNSANNIISLYILNGFIRRHYLNYHLKYIDKLFPINTSSKIFMNEVFKVPNNKMEILPLGVDNEYTGQSFILENKKKFRNKYGIPDDAYVLFSGGKLNKEKRIEDLLNAFIEFNFNNCYLIIIGQFDVNNENYNNKILNLVNSNNKIFYLGWISGLDIYKVMASTDIAIFPGTQSVLWQQSIGMGLVTIVSRYIIGNNNIIHNQNVEYLNFNKNLIILESIYEKDIEILNILKHMLTDKTYFENLQYNSKSIPKLYLNYNTIIQKTIN